MKTTIPDMHAYESLKEIVRVASIQLAADDPVPPSPERIWAVIQDIITGAKGKLDDSVEISKEQGQYYCTLDQIQADLAHELGIGTDAVP